MRDAEYSILARNILTGDVDSRQFTARHFDHVASQWSDAERLNNHPHIPLKESPLRTADTKNLRQAWDLPTLPRPIVLIGAGGIVNDAHLPAYRKAGLPVAGIFDLDRSRSEMTARKFDVPVVYDSLSQAVSVKPAVFDIAIRPEHTAAVLEELEPGSTVLMQKPMGKDLADAKHIRRICQDRSLCAAVNFQLRFSPMMLAVQDTLERGWIGQILDVDIHLNLHTPWEQFPFLKNLERVEILVHSVHYLDWIRSILGEPQGVYARTVGHPQFPELGSTRTSAILDYGDTVRCSLSINHNFAFGPNHQVAAIRIEGDRGAAVVKLGLLLNYPEGEPDELEIITKGTSWQPVAVRGGWFPDAFIGTMSNLQRFADGEDEILHTAVEDAYRTMALVEACYVSDAHGATPIEGT